MDRKGEKKTGNPEESNAVKGWKICGRKGIQGKYITGVRQNVGTAGKRKVRKLVVVCGCLLAVAGIGIAAFAAVGARLGEI